MLTHVTILVFLSPLLGYWACLRHKTSDFFEWSACSAKEKTLHSLSWKGDTDGLRMSEVMCHKEQKMIILTGEGAEDRAPHLGYLAFAMISKSINFRIFRYNLSVFVLSPLDLVFEALYEGTRSPLCFQKWQIHILKNTHVQVDLD